MNEKTEWLAGVLNNLWSHPKQLIYTQMRKKWVYAMSGLWRICFHQAQIFNWIKNGFLMQAENSHVFSHCVFLCGDNIADFWSQTTITWCCIDKLSSSCCCFSLSALIQFNEEVLLDFFSKKDLMVVYFWEWFLSLTYGVAKGWMMVELWGNQELYLTVDVYTHKEIQACPYIFVSFQQRQYSPQLRFLISI